MALPEGYGEAYFKFTVVGDSEPMGFTMGFQGNNGTAADLGVAAADLVTTFKDNYADVGADLLDGWVFLGADITINPTDGPESIIYIPDGLVGTTVDPGLPINCATLVKKGTYLTGRKNQGRYYIPPFALPEDEVTQAGFLSAGALVSAQAKATGWFTDFTATIDNSMVIFHADGSQPTDIEFLEVQPRIATQRRRLR